MNLPGGTRPRSGSASECSASTPTIAPRCEVDLRLVVQDELAPARARAAACSRGSVLGHPLRHLRVVEEITLAGLLGLLERRLGVAKEHLGVAPCCG